MKSIYIAASFLVTLASPLTVSSASFDCSKAGRPTEKMICADPELSLLDENISATYKKLLAKNPDIKSAQIEWIKETRKCESSSAPSDCLKDQYKNRLADLNRELNAEQTQSVPTASTESEKSAPVIPEPSQPKSPTEVKTESKESGGSSLLYILLAIGGIAAAFLFLEKEKHFIIGFS